MKIHIRQINPAGIELQESLSSEWVGLTQKDNIRFVGPVTVKAEINRVDDEVFVKITASSCYQSSCYRCLEDMKKDWSTDFTLIFDIDKQEEFIDISEDVRQELILNLPARVLCQENCKGLCVDCGVNLNNQECEHKHSIVSSKV